MNCIWTIVLLGVAFFSTINVSSRVQILMPLFWAAILAFAFSIEVYCGKTKPNIEKFDNIIIRNRKTLSITFYVGLVFNVARIIYEYQVIGDLGGGLDQLSVESQWLRMAYLDYSRNEMTLIEQIISNILSYGATIGLIASCLLSFFDGKMWRLFVYILFSVIGAVITMSKFSFILDLCYILSIYIIYRNIKVRRIVKKRKEKRKYTLIIAATLSLIVLLFTIMGTQRGYESKSSNIQGVDNMIVFEGIAYTLTPYMAFQTIMDKNIDYSYGVKTFNPFFKLFGIEYKNFGSIDVGLSDTTVYTMPGVFYADFGFVGSLLFMCLFILLATLLFRKVIENFTISCLGIYMVINTILLFSFFTWLGRMTIFWFFPVVLFVYDKLFIKKYDTRNSFVHNLGKRKG